MDVNLLINESVSLVKNSESKRKNSARKLSPLKGINLKQFDSPELLEENFSQKIKKAELNERIAGVDSGFTEKRLHSIDIVLVRTIAVAFDYKKGKLEKAQYFPSPTYFPKPFISSNSLENDEFFCNRSLLRLKEEILAAIEAIKQFKPQYCFLDGSIVPQHADKPRVDSKLVSFYQELIELYEQLYETAEKNSCNLLAAVEDSRGSRFRTILEKEILSKKALVEHGSFSDCFDSNILDYLLEKNERSFCFNYSSSVKEHPILKDFSDKWAERIKVFYLKATEHDRPLRLEFLHNSADLTEYCNKIASTALSLSSLHKEYAFPSILIEADLHARLTPNEIKTLFDKITDRLGRENAFLAQRRESRPF